MHHLPEERGTTALFKNPILEQLARTHISVPLTIYIIGSTSLIYFNFEQGYTSTWGGIGIFFLGLFFWTWFEYFMHKRIFHMFPSNLLKEKLQYTFHGVHHEYPRDKTRLAMPPAASVMIMTILFFIFKLIIGNYVFTFLPGFAIGYSLYLFIHFSVHAFTPPKNIMNALWINHSIHHYKDDTVAYGVSSPLWDFILRTMPKKTYKKHNEKRHNNKNAID